MVSAEIGPMPFQWDAAIGVMRPRYPKRSADIYQDQVFYLFVPFKPRSKNSHSHQFAWLHKAWENLPEELSAQYPTEDHLRKRALIQAGFYDEEIIDCETQKAAMVVASFARRHDDFAWIVVRGPLCVIRTAKSQTMFGPNAMDHETFQRSKTAIMEIIAEMIGVTSAQLSGEGGNTT